MNQLKLTLLLVLFFVLLNLACSSKEEGARVSPQSLPSATEQPSSSLPSPPPPGPTPQSVSVSGFGAYPPAAKVSSAAQGRLMAKRAAQLDANRKLQELLTAPPHGYSKEKALLIAQASVKNFEYREAAEDQGINCLLEIEFILPHKTPDSCLEM